MKDEENKNKRRAQHTLIHNEMNEWMSGIKRNNINNSNSNININKKKAETETSSNIYYLNRRVREQFSNCNISI